MKRRFIPRRNDKSFMISPGWLFADLLLALAVLFLVANTLAIKPPPPAPRTIKKPAIKLTPTPTPLPRLELNFHEFTIHVDPNGLLSNNRGAIASVEQQVRAQSILKGRSVGLVIVYDGAPTVSQISTAQTISRKIYSILKGLGNAGFAFTRASYYNPLYNLGDGTNAVTVDAYLFAE
jgi:hypothetical protein